MEEVKMALDVPTLATLCEQQFATDEEWQMWYGRENYDEYPGLFSGVIQSSDDEVDSFAIQKGVEDTHHMV